MSDHERRQWVLMESRKLEEKAHRQEDFVPSSFGKPSEFLHRKK